MRAENKKLKLTTPEDLGFSEPLRLKIRELAQRKNGMLLAAGPPMSGVTTLAFAMVRGIDPYLYTVYNITDAEGRDLGHVSTFEGNAGDNLVQTIGRAKRAEADVLYVEPIRNAELARTLIDEADEVCIISELAALDAAGASCKCANGWGRKAGRRADCGVARAAADPADLPQVPHGVPSQSQAAGEGGAASETSVLYRPPPPDENDTEYEPCSRCGGVGYFGRAAMYEFLEMTDGMKQVVASGGDAAAIKQQARTEKMQTLQSDGLRLVAEGKSSLEELQRVFKGG